MICLWVKEKKSYKLKSGNLKEKTRALNRGKQ
jgi:hypothetical protein